MLLKYSNTINPVSFTLNNVPIIGSGLLNFNTPTTTDFVSWCIGPFMEVQAGWANYTVQDLGSAARQSQLSWIIQDQGWSDPGAMTSLQQDAFALLLNEAWLEDQTNPMDLDSGSITLVGAAPVQSLADTWLSASINQTITPATTVNLYALIDPLGQNQATFVQDPNTIPEPLSLLLISGVILGSLVVKQLRTRS